MAEKPTPKTKQFKLLAVCAIFYLLLLIAVVVGNQAFVIVALACFIVSLVALIYLYVGKFASSFIKEFDIYSVNEFVSNILIFMGIVALLLAFMIWGWQILSWLREGTWTQLPISKFIKSPETEWLGVHKIINEIWDVNIGAIGIIMVGLALCGWETFENFISEKRPQNTMEANMNKPRVEILKKGSEEGFDNVWYICYVGEEKTRSILFSGRSHADLEEDKHDEVDVDCRSRLLKEPRGGDLTVVPHSRTKFTLEPRQ